VVIGWGGTGRSDECALRTTLGIIKRVGSREKMIMYSSKDFDWNCYIVSRCRVSGLSEIPQGHLMKIQMILSINKIQMIAY
jgi:hypothetical protein